METPAKNYVLLELHVPDFKPVINFYNKLGFKEVWQRKPEGFKGYLVLEKENNILCFWAGNDMVWEQGFFKKYPKNSKRGYGVEIVLMVENAARMTRKMIYIDSGFRRNDNGLPE